MCLDLISYVFLYPFSTRFEGYPCYHWHLRVHDMSNKNTFQIRKETENIETDT